MFRYSRFCVALLVAWLRVDAVAAELDASAVASVDITPKWPSFVFFSLAAAFFLALLFRSLANHLLVEWIAKLRSRRLRKLLIHNSKDVLSAFVIPGAYGGLTAIDHAILTSGGILCIRAKHYDGVIFGGQCEPQWTNVDGANSQRFLNPIIQNDGRTKALQNIVPEVPVANLVVFTGRVEFTSVPAKNVVHISQLQSYIAKFEFGPCKVDDWDSVWMTVTGAAKTDEKSRKDLGAQLSFS